MLLMGSVEEIERGESSIVSASASATVSKVAISTNGGEIVELFNLWYDDKLARK